MTQPLVSVITAAYNAEKYIGVCMDSVLSQTYQNWDMWIVDDASKDDTQRVVQNYLYHFPNIHYIRTAENTGGPAAPRNIALTHARGRYVAFLDGDDMLMPTKLEEQIAFMQEKDCAISYTGYRRVNGEGTRIGHFKSIPARTTYKGYLSKTCIPMSSAMIDRDKTGEIHFDEELPRGRDDLALWVDLLKKGHQAFGLNKDLMRFRQGHGSISGHFLEMAKGTWKVYEKYADNLSFLERATAFVGYGLNAVRKRIIF